MASVKVFFNSNGEEHTKYIKNAVKSMIKSMRGSVYFSTITEDTEECIEQQRID